MSGWAPHSSWILRRLVLSSERSEQRGWQCREVVPNIARQHQHLERTECRQHVAHDTLRSQKDWPQCIKSCLGVTWHFRVHVITYPCVRNCICRIPFCTWVATPLSLPSLPLSLHLSLPYDGSVAATTRENYVRTYVRIRVLVLVAKSSFFNLHMYVLGLLPIESFPSSTQREVVSGRWSRL